MPVRAGPKPSARSSPSSLDGIVEQRTTLELSVASARAARRFVRDAVADEDLDEQVLDAIELLTSEVVTNAMIHARSPAELVVRSVDDRIRVEIIDDDPAEPQVRYADEMSLSGRGLVIVDAVADDWGVDRLEEGGKRVWFEVATSAGEQVAAGKRAR